MSNTKGVGALISPASPIPNMAAMQQQRRQEAGLNKPVKPATGLPDQDPNQESDDLELLKQTIEMLRDQLAVKDRTIADLMAVNKALADNINASRR